MFSLLKSFTVNRSVEFREKLQIKWVLQRKLSCLCTQCFSGVSVTEFLEICFYVLANTSKAHNLLRLLCGWHHSNAQTCIRRDFTSMYTFSKFKLFNIYFWEKKKRLTWNEMPIVKPHTSLDTVFSTHVEIQRTLNANTNLHTVTFCRHHTAGIKRANTKLINNNNKKRQASSSYCWHTLPTVWFFYR